MQRTVLLKKENVALRPISDEDKPFLLSVFHSTRVEELAQARWGPGELDAFIAQQFNFQHIHYMRYYAGKNTRFDILEHNGKPIGRLYVGRYRDEIRIIDISILPQHRNRGLGTKILKKLLNEGQKTGKTVSIHVECYNPALRLYERLGFKNQRDEKKDVYLFMKWSPETETKEPPPLNWSTGKKTITY